MLGVINLLKPTGLTSSDCVGRVKWLLKRFYKDKGIRVGHLGTLDPLGAGVLPIVFGKATRLFDYCQHDNKIYRSRFQFGTATDTLDSEGRIVVKEGIIPNIDAITSIIPSFIGAIMQIPPQFSSISVGGVRGYEAARKGIALDISSREVIINDIIVNSYIDGVLDIDVYCRGGVYIRSLCRDIAAALSTVAYMASIIRLDNKGMSIDNSVTLDELELNVGEHILSIDSLIGELPRIDINADEAFKLLNGVVIPARKIDGDYIVLIEGETYGICRDENSETNTIIRLWDK